MLHPVGPLPGSTYWRRRSVLVAALVVTVVLVKGVLLSGGNSDATTPRAQRPTQLVSASSTTKPGSQPTASRRAVPTCSARALKLLVGSARDAYRVGTVVDLTLSVINMTDTTCRGELGPRVQDVVVYHARHRLWSSTDCHPANHSAVETLRPGELRRLIVRWSGRTSTPGCGGKPARVGTGRYTVVGTVGARCAAAAFWCSAKRRRT